MPWPYGSEASPWLPLCLLDPGLQGSRAMGGVAERAHETRTNFRLLVPREAGSLIRNNMENLPDNTMEKSVHWGDQSREGISVNDGGPNHNSSRMLLMGERWLVRTAVTAGALALIDGRGGA